MKHSSTLLAFAFAAALYGCSREVPTPGSTATPAATATIARIVFVDQAKCCACTRERIDNSWKALTDVVGYPPIPDVERIHMDSQADKAAPYTKQKPVMVPPAIYFFDQKGRLVQMLQGEVDVAQIKRVMGRT